MRPADHTTVVFDLGGVVLQWDPRRPYEQVMPAQEVADFLARIDFETWNRRHDAGHRFEVGEQELIERFPESATAIRAYREHFPRSLTGLVPGTGAVIAELLQSGARLLALSNWSAETFPHAQARFGLLRRFEAIVVSGQELLAKPDPAIFRLLLERYGLDPASTVFVDDSLANVATAASLGITALPFRDATTLRADLVAIGLLTARTPLAEPLFHLTEAETWRAAQAAGAYPWSTRALTFEEQGYVHCSFAAQVPGVRQRVYPDVADDDLLLLEVDPHGLDVVVEDLGAGEAYPHLYAPLPLAAVRSTPR